MHKEVGKKTKFIAWALFGILISFPTLDLMSTIITVILLK